MKIMCLQVQQPVKCSPKWIPMATRKIPSQNLKNRTSVPQNVAKKISKIRKRKQIPADSSSSTPADSPKKELSEEEKKKHADNLWACFKKDTDLRDKDSSRDEKKGDDALKPAATKVNSTQSETLKVTQVFEFAGEEVKIEKEVRVDSVEARLSQVEQSASASGSALSKGAPPKRKPGGLGGIGSVLNQLGKKQKLSTLEKTQLDWNRFKQQQNIEDELESYKKGKDGYLDRQDFLQRADLRRFEIERDIRTIERNKRLNNAPGP